MSQNIPAKTIETTLGAPLIREEENQYGIDLTEIRIFWGLSILSRTLGDEIVERVLNEPGDIAISHKINPNINAELVEMHIGYIQIYVRAGVLKDILTIRDEFQDHLRAVFGTFQRQIWARIIHPEFYGENPLHTTSKALVFPFHHASPNEKIDYQFILERVPNQKEPGEFLFRLTIENYDRANMDLESIPHVIVDDLDSRTYIAGSTKISESIHFSVVSACQRGEKKYVEENRRFSRIFEQIRKTLLGSLEEIHFLWDEEFSQLLIERNPRETLPIFKKLFLILEDHIVTEFLKKGYCIRVRIHKLEIFIDLSRLDRVLNFSFSHKRHSLDLHHYLSRMPELEKIVFKNTGKYSRSFRFDGFHIFLVHHITSEILGLLDAFRKLGAESVFVAFVKYGGKIPAAYLDVLLDLPADQFFMCGLELKVGKDQKVFYSVSPVFSEIEGLKPLKDFLDREELGFFEAMKLLSIHVFLSRCIDLIQKEEKLLLVEDGGYIAPFLNQHAIDGLKTQEVLELYRIDSGKYRKERWLYESFSDFLNAVMIGSVEHTRNGYNRLMNVRNQYERLHLPAYSIAISIQKTKEESREVAHSILKAIEDIFHGQGKIMSRRKFLILGAAGNIGSFLCKYLRAGRLHESNEHLLEVDIRNSPSDWKYTSIQEIPKQKIYDTDTILGVIGESILTKEFWEEFLTHGYHKNIYIASGSTKTLEFTHLIAWVNDFFIGKIDSILGRKVTVQTERIIDPQSGMDQGALIILKDRNEESKWEKRLYFFSDLSPVNFLYYGAPTEIMDSIISQLLTISLGMVNQYRKGNLPPPDLYAVDFEIDCWGNLLG